MLIAAVHEAAAVQVFRRCARKSAWRDSIIVGTVRRAHKCGMTDVAQTTEVICPVCGQTMTHLRRIKRAFNGDLDVFLCKSCNFSTTYALKMASAA